MRLDGLSKVFFQAIYTACCKYSIEKYVFNRLPAQFQITYSCTDENPALCNSDTVKETTDIYLKQINDTRRRPFYSVTAPGIQSVFVLFSSTKELPMSNIFIDTIVMRPYVFVFFAALSIWSRARPGSIAWPVIGMPGNMAAVAPNPVR